MKNQTHLLKFIESWNFTLPPLDKLVFLPKEVKGSEHSPFKIALIDTGINISHPGFKNARIIAKDFTEGQNLEDELGHGTHCAGILISQCDRELIGLCPEATLYSAKILGRIKRDKSKTEQSIVNAFKWAIAENVHVVLMTLGCRRGNNGIKEIIEKALQKGIKIIVSAGNHNGSLPLFPATLPGVICVSALGKNGLPLPECYQGELVDVFAPGESIRSAYFTNWQEMSGSSQAAAVFCGLMVADFLKLKK